MRPPLSCRTSPPQGGRLAVTSVFANLRRFKRSGKAEAANLPLEGPILGGCPPPACQPPAV
ncbi:hypothetical protein EN859_034300 [Mesorhizobium sp. M00.F.Ca.ET.216.01.1.1]|nr:hypothetical protein EN859_034300 [Mesorhizobium sp. M00.F.Ca.ET.216.01.1.1]